MSDLASTSALLKTSPQLPVDWYVDQRVYEIEQQLLFARGPNYIGHELMVPSVGDFHSLEWMNHAKTLVRTEQGVGCSPTFSATAKPRTLSVRCRTATACCSRASETWRKT